MATGAQMAKKAFEAPWPRSCGGVFKRHGWSRCRVFFRLVENRTLLLWDFGEDEELYIMDLVIPRIDSFQPDGSNVVFFFSGGGYLGVEF